MGTYIPAGPTRKRSVSDTLIEAEEEHFLDCPNADIFVRAAAFLLDLIFAYLIYSALQRLQKVALGYVLTGVNPRSALGGIEPLEGPAITVAYVTMVLKIVAVYFYFLWAVVTFGGTPGKLLMGLRVLQSETGKKLTITRLFLRELPAKAASALLFGYLLSLVRKDKKTLHDLLTGTVVKRVQGEA